MPRVVLLLPTATYRAPDFMAAAEALGIEVVVGSERMQAMARSMEGRALVVPLQDTALAVEAIAQFHARHPVDAVVAVDDQGVIVAAHAAARLGLPRANPPGAVAATRDKLALRQALEAAGVRQPWWSVWDGPRGWSTYPCVLKPVGLSGSQGVIRADSAEEAVSAAARIAAIVAAADPPCDPTILVEAFVPGVEVAVEGLVAQGELRVLALFDKPDPLDGPYFEETIYVTPSRLDGAVQRRVEETVAGACAALGLVEGPVHAEARIGPDGEVTLLEVAARSIGGLCARSLRFGLGVSLEELILRHAVGLSSALEEREAQASGVMMLPIPRSGELVAVGGQEAARSTPGVEGLEITVPIGRTVRALPEGDRYLGFLFAKGATPEEVESGLRKAHAALEVEIVG